MFKYYNILQSGKEATINIFGDITSVPIEENDISSYSLVKELEQLDKTVDTINVYISSYGGEVKEGISIYNQLKRHKAKINTYCDSFACSIASVIFMAGDNRIMYDNSLLMIHNAWCYFEGNATDIRKMADDLEKITESSISIYMNRVNISEKKLRQMMDEETWITSNEALNMGFATKVLKDNSNSSKACASAKKLVLGAVKNNRDNHITNNINNYKTYNENTLIGFLNAISK